MKNSIKTLLTFGLLLALLCACNKAEKLDEQKDYILIKAIKSAQNQSLVDIDVDDLENYASICEQKGARGKYCLANALIGYKLYFEKDFDKSIIHLKKAEANLEYCDSIASFVYGYISSNFSTTDTLLALKYLDKALLKDLESNNLRRLPYSYLEKACLIKGDSAKFYLHKSMELLDEWGDKMAKCQYAYKHFKEMEPDTIIEYILPYYDSISFTGYASVLANAYLDKGDIDSALVYMSKMGNKKNLQAKLYFYNLRLFTLKGEYVEACQWGEMAYKQLYDECKFMLSQRLGAINAEYDLLNAELQNEKRRVKIMIVYNVVLLVLLVLLSVTFVILKRYKHDNNVKEIDIAKRKERFNVLFEKYKSDYKMDKGEVMTESMQNLEKLHEAYPSLTRTEVAIVWLLFMRYSTDSICDVLNITHNYYYQRKTVIYRTFNIKGKDSENVIDKIVREHIFVN
jgi:hypothetical protein